MKVRAFWCVYTPLGLVSVGGGHFRVPTSFHTSTLMEDTYLLSRLPNLFPPSYLDVTVVTVLFPFHLPVITQSFLVPILPLLYTKPICPPETVDTVEREKKR